MKKTPNRKEAKKKGTVYVGLYMPVRLHVALMKRAKNTRRSKSAEIVVALADSLGVALLGRQPNAKDEWK